MFGAFGGIAVGHFKLGVLVFESAVSAVDVTALSPPPRFWAQQSIVGKLSGYRKDLKG